MVTVYFWTMDNLTKLSECNCHDVSRLASSSNFWTLS